MKINYIKMSLFDAPKQACLVHACNAQGAWFSGIAKPFKENYPNAFLVYKEACQTIPSLGKAYIIRDADHYIGCLITSQDFGVRKDPPDLIIKNTRKALAEFITALPHNTPIYSNRFNSGLFEVPFIETENLIAELNDSRIWNVCDL